MTPVRSAGGVVVSRKGKVLVVSQDGAVWSLPKGRLKSGETELDATKREIKEESGVADLDYIKPLGRYSRCQVGKDGKTENKQVMKIITLFLFSTNQLQLKPEDPKNPEARWILPRHVEKVLTITKDQAFYSSVLPDVLKFIAESEL